MRSLTDPCTLSLEPLLFLYNEPPLPTNDEDERKRFLWIFLASFFPICKSFEQNSVFPMCRYFEQNGGGSHFQQQSQFKHFPFLCWHRFWLLYSFRRSTYQYPVSSLHCILVFTMQSGSTLSSSFDNVGTMVLNWFFSGSPLSWSPSSKSDSCFSSGLSWRSSAFWDVFWQSLHRQLSAQRFPDATHSQNFLRHLYKYKIWIVRQSNYINEWRLHKIRLQYTEQIQWRTDSFGSNSPSCWPFYRLR